MQGGEALVWGLGVSGSYLLYELSARGLNARGVEASRVYSKPCGDAVTLRPWIKALLEELDVVETSVRRYIVRASGRELVSVEFRGPNWYIINKAELVSKLRGLASRSGARISIANPRSARDACSGARFCVDARGPYKHPRSTWVLAYRIIAAPREPWDPETAVLDFYPERGGLYWLFPADDRGRRVNLGAGFLGAGVSEARRAAVELARGDLGSFEVRSEKAAPIAVWAPIRLIDPQMGSFNVGEAAGLVISTAGEGNRPGLESARALAVALEEDQPARRYRELAGRLVSEALASRLALRLAYASPGLFRAIAVGGGLGFWRDYLSARLDMGTMLRHVARVLASRGGG